MIRIAGALRGRTVLIVHEDAFWGAYLADVLTAAGAVVVGPALTTASGLELVGAARPQAIVLGQPMRDGRARAIIDIAAECGIVALVVQPSRLPPGTACLDLPALTSPYAGFQVAEALVAMFATTGSWVCGPVLRGH